MDASERDLINSALSGDRPAFERLIRDYHRRVYAVAFALLLDRPEAEDVVQETFWKAYRDRGTVRAPERFPGWLLTVARNTARDRRRRGRARPPRADVNEAAELPDPRAPRPDEELQRAEAARRLQEALAALPERHRLVLTLRYFDGLDHAAIGRVLDLSDGALRGLLGRGLATLRAALLRPEDRQSPAAAGSPAAPVLAAERPLPVPSPPPG